MARPWFFGRPEVEVVLARPRPGIAAQVALRTMDDILRTCPTAAEVAAIQKDFAFTFDSPPGPIVCTTGGTESGVMLSLINAFRCMKVLTFDSPIPVVGATNLYTWLKSHAIGIHVMDGTGLSHSGNPISIRRDVLAGWWERKWDVGGGAGMMSLIGLFVHEGVHTINGILHDCPDGASDPSLDFGGAWAGQYWYEKWLADHSGEYLTAAQRKMAAFMAEDLRVNGRLSCGKKLAPLPGFAAIDPRVRNAYAEVKRATPVTVQVRSDIATSVPFTRTGAVEDPPLMMVPARPCPCEAMEALLRELGEPESDNWLEHFAQEDRRVIPALRALGFAEAAAQIVADHAVMRKQIRATGEPDAAMLAKHAAFEDALVKDLGEKIVAMREWHRNEHKQEELHERWRRTP